MEARILNLGVPETLAGGLVLMAAAGSFYDPLVWARRQRSGGRLGIRVGVRLLPLRGGRCARSAAAERGDLRAGVAATGVWLPLVWGGCSGFAIPFIHHYLQDQLETGSKNRAVAREAATSTTSSRSAAVAPSGADVGQVLESLAFEVVAFRELALESGRG